MSRIHDALQLLNQTEFDAKAHEVGQPLLYEYLRLPSAADPRLSSDPLHQQAEQELTNLVQRVFLFPKTKAPHVVLLYTITEKRSDSPSLCFRIAEILSAQSSRKVCVIDASKLAVVSDRKPARSDATECAPESDDGDRLTDCTSLDTDRRVKIVAAGSLGADTPGFYGSDTWRKRLSKLRQEFEYILIDAMSAAPFSDTSLLARSTDGTILVIEANSTRRETARLAKDDFARAGVNILGAILNNRRFPIPETIYRKL